MQIISKLYLQSENRNTNLKFLTNANKEKDRDTSLGSSRGIKDISRIEK